MNLARIRLRMGIRWLPRRRRAAIAAGDRTSECPGCDKTHEIESVWHFLLVCSRWSIKRELLVANVMLSDISPTVEGAWGVVSRRILTCGCD